MSSATSIVSCARCERTIPVERINVVTGIGRCDSCGLVFAIPRSVEGSSKLAVTPMPKVSLPAAITVYDAQTPAPAISASAYRDQSTLAASPEFQIVRRWFRWGAIYELVFGLMWACSSIFWCFLAGASAFLVWGLPFVAVGFWMLYKAVKSLLNRTTITVREGVLTVKHGPIPVRGGIDLRVRDIEQLYCVERVTNPKGYGGPTVRYELHLQTKLGGTLTLVADLPEANQALYLEQAIEERLGIPDRKVVGELARVG